MTTVVFLAALARLPRDGQQRGRTTPVGPGQVPPGARSRVQRWRDPIAGTLVGLAAFATVWGFLSQPAQGRSVAEEYLRLTPAAHGGDTVTVIVADFRGLDTAVEITVLLVAVIGVATLLRRGRLW